MKCYTSIFDHKLPATPPTVPPRLIESIIKVALLCMGLSCNAVAQVPNAHLQIDVDATQVARRVIHSHLRIPVSGNHVTLSYPLWNPGDHAPFQHVGQLAELSFHAAGKLLSWRRDLVDADAFHIDVAPGTATVEADFDFVLPVPGEALADSSQRLLILRWNLYLLYVDDGGARETPVDASVRLPHGRRFATALRVKQNGENTVRFAQTSLETLIDSPVLCGQFIRSYDLSPGESVAHKMDVAAEKNSDLPDDAEIIKRYGPLVRQAKRMFGSEHFDSYHFLVAASSFTTPGAGFEHFESSDIRLPSNFFHESQLMLFAADLLPHEYAHSWNGKYRSPTDLYSMNFQQPEKTDLL